MVTDQKYNQGPTQRVVRYEALDGFRGFAALLIVLFHIGWPTHITQNGFVHNGYLMVDLFFMLSGFFIAFSHPWAPVGSSQVLKFLGLRLFRLYPVHLTVLAALVGLELFKVLMMHHGTIILNHMPFTDRYSVAALIGNIFMLQGFGIFPHNTWNGPSWYISCLFAAYILFALGVFSVLLRNRIVFFAAIVLALSGYVFLAVLRQSLSLTVDLAMARCMCGFFLGMAVYQFSSRNPGLILSLQSSRWLSWIEAATLTAMVLIMSLATGWQVVLAIPVFAVMVVVFQTDRGMMAPILKSRTAKFLSRISYSIYMWQIFIMITPAIILHKVFKIALAPNQNLADLLTQIGPWTGDLLLAIDIAVLLAISTATYYFIEKPALAFGKRCVASM